MWLGGWEAKLITLINEEKGREYYWRITDLWKQDFAPHFLKKQRNAEMSYEKIIFLQQLEEYLIFADKHRTEQQD